jgi:hypothetical protein
VNEDPTKDKPGKFTWMLNLSGPICLFVVMAYFLFEAYWTEQTLDWGRGASFRWISYQTSPDTFVWHVGGDALLFLVASWAIVAAARGRGIGK